MLDHGELADFATRCMLSYLADTEDNSLLKLVKDAQRRTFPSLWLRSRIRCYVIHRMQLERGVYADLLPRCLGDVDWGSVSENLLGSARFVQTAMD